MSGPFELRKYIATALDPIHIGTGGYKIGRVDNSVIRDFDNVPKIPGTSIAGAIRSYAASQFEKLDCAGKDDPREGGGGIQCGGNDCPICVTFGYSTENSARSSMASFFDARILFFPVSTMNGPVWITTPQRLKEFLGKDMVTGLNEDEKFCSVSGIPPSGNQLNLGWLLLTKKEGCDFPLTGGTDRGEFMKINPYILKRVICITENIFPLVVNSNLEVRTSVSINPFTGAAIDGALFTYEGVPRTTVFWFDVAIQDYIKYYGEHKRFYDEVRKKSSNLADKTTFVNGECIDAAIKVVEAGMSYCDKLGIGGMNTRGFGRVKIETQECEEGTT